MAGIKEIARKRQLSSLEKVKPTGIIPLGKISSMLVLLDGTQQGCEEELEKFASGHGISLRTVYLAWAVESKTPAEATIRKEDLDWAGRPSDEKCGPLLDPAPDLLVSLVDGTPYPLEYLAKRCDARFKVGRKQLPGDTFDVVFPEPRGEHHTQSEAFSQIVKFLETIA